MVTDNAHSPPQGIKKGWWSRFLERLIKANKDSLQQGCRT